MADERRLAREDETERQRANAARQLLAALTGYVTVYVANADRAAEFASVPAPAQVHQRRRDRIEALLRVDATTANLLPGDVRVRWDALMWLVRFCDSHQEGREEDLRRRDAKDLEVYAEYVRRSLWAIVSDGEQLPMFPAPDVRRGGLVPWGLGSDHEVEEPDLRDWFESSRLVGRVKYVDGRVAWFGPNGVLPDG